MSASILPLDRRLRGASSLLLALLALLLLAPSVSAEPPFRVSSQIEDRAGVLGANRSAAEAAIEELRQTEQVQLWMVYVNTFSGLDANDWANATAEESDLGLNDVLIAVAVEDRAYAYSVDQDFPLSNSQLNAVMTNDVEPALSEDDWAGAAIGAANGMQATLRGGTAGQDGDAGGGWGGSILIAVIVVIVLVVLVAFFALRGRKKAAPGARQAGPARAEAPPIPLAELRKQANLQLVETDDAIKTSQEELGFAVAEFGEEAAVPFRDALEDAERQLADAFRLRKELDEAREEPEQRRLLTGILQHTTAANDRLDAEAERFDKLRDLEHTAPQLLTSLEQRIAEVDSRLPQAQQTLAELGQVYAPTAVSPVAANPQEAQGRLDFAREQVVASHEDLDAGRRGEAVVTALAAEEAAGQAQQLLDAVERLRTDLAGAAASIDEAIAETERDIAEARAIGDQAQFAPLIATARTAADAAKQAASPDGGRDPLAALLRLREADDALEKALQPVRDARTQRAKAAASLERALLGARAEVASATDYITTHRGAVSSEPRTHLADAQQNLKQALALADADPATAARHAVRAQELATAALYEAQSDVATAESGGFGPAVPGGGMGNMAGALIGGILISSMLGGGGGFGGGRRGGFGGGGRRGGFGGFGPGSFGGGGTRMRRGGGGRF